MRCKLPQRPGWLLQRLTLESGLFLLALLVYLFTRLIGLQEFPIYFFTDEAAQTLLAADLVRDGFHGYDGQFLPTYFLNVYQYNLSASVYIQVLPYLLFGASVWVTRATSALLSLVAAVSVGLTVRKIFRSKHAWVAVMLLSITPAWILHSRTAFETSLATSFYAGFLYLYLCYRQGSHRSLYPAIVLSALTFYTYSPIRLVVLLTAALLFFTDLRYHWQVRRHVLWGLGLALLLAAPEVRFQLTHPGENLQHLQVLNSYWVKPLPLDVKLMTYFKQYLTGLDPAYWYLPGSGDLARHLMKGYGHVLLATLPAALAGIWSCLRRWRSPEHRALLISLLTAPSGAALVGIGITRALVMVVPLAILSGLGIATAVEWLQSRWKAARRVLLLLLFSLLALFNLRMLQDALINGRFWFTDYGLGGMQYGAVQVFNEIEDYLERSPSTRIILSPSWANGTDMLARFFFNDPLPFEVGSIVGSMEREQALDDQTLFIMIPDEYQKVLESEKFTRVQVEKTLPFPDGRPGFYFVRLRYVDGVESIFEAEREQRRKLLEHKLVVGGIPALVKYSYLDMGSIDLVFDGDSNTLVRTLEANPLQVQVEWSKSRQVERVSVRIGGTATKVQVRLQNADGKELIHASQTVGDEPNPRTLTFALGNAYEANRLLISVTSINSPEPAHVHLWEVTVE
ncbi:MAG: glycosyltransferase family 39 protein [Anaerolineaceae bacterium]|nr:glycosyltransferase family 39 protein [Anaerolineaceae bacterium]